MIIVAKLKNRPAIKSQKSPRKERYLSEELLFLRIDNVGITNGHCKGGIAARFSVAQLLQVPCCNTPSQGLGYLKCLCLGIKDF